MFGLTFSGELVLIKCIYCKEFFGIFAFGKKLPAGGDEAFSCFCPACGKKNVAFGRKVRVEIKEEEFE